jgi:DNA-binding NarL/FixJ family response regulator
MSGDCITSRQGAGARMLMGTPLKPIQKKICGLVSEGLPNKEIAYRLGLSCGSVKQYMHHIFSILGIGNRTQLALWFIKHEQNW